MFDFSGRKMRAAAEEKEAEQTKPIPARKPRRSEGVITVTEGTTIWLGGGGGGETGTVIVKDI